MATKEDKAPPPVQVPVLTNRAGLAKLITRTTLTKPLRIVVYSAKGSNYTSSKGTKGTSGQRKK